MIRRELHENNIINPNKISDELNHKITQDMKAKINSFKQSRELSRDHQLPGT